MSDAIMPIAQSRQEGDTASVEQRIAAVAFCADKNMEVPLHVAASSLLRHLGAGYIARFYLLLTGFSKRDIGRLRSTLNLSGRLYSMELLEPSAGWAFADYPGLHGSRSTYHRLLLPDLVDEERLLYVDADVQVKTDIAPLFEEDMGSSPVGFVVDGEVRYALDHQFQTMVGRALDAPVFNAGVCLFNLGEWHRQSCTERLLALGAKYRNELISHDQSMLNALFADDCYRLDRKYNVKIWPNCNTKEVPSTGLLHFVGSPKPWDIGARYFLPHAEQWYRDLQDTALPLSKRVSWLSATSWARVPRIAGGYLRALRSAVK